MLGSCSSDDSYERAPQVAADVAGAYFANSNSSSDILTPEDYASQPADTLKVLRKSTKGDVSVPVVVDRADAVFDIPSAVNFKDGDSIASLVVKYQNMETRTEYKYTIHLDESGTNPYTKVDGSEVFNYTVMISSWEKVVEGAQIKLYYGEIPTTTSDIYHLDGVNKFYIENFLGSGVNLSFKIIPADKSGTYTEDAFDPEDMSTWTGSFVPCSNYYLQYDSSYDYYYWWLMTDSNDYAGWSIDGHEHGGISYINFMQDATSENYGSIDMNGSSSSSAGWLEPYIYYADGETSGWTYLYIYFDNSNVPVDILKKYTK